MRKNLSTALVPTTRDFGFDSERLANDPRIAAVASIFANAMIMALSPWLAHFNVARSRETPILLSADEARAYVLQFKGFEQGHGVTYSIVSSHTNVAYCMDCAVSLPAVLSTTMRASR